MSSTPTVNTAFAVVFALIGAFMIWMGIAMVSAGPQNSTEWIIGLGGFFTGALLLYSAWSTWKKGKKQLAAEQKETARLASKYDDSTFKVENTSSDESTPVILCRWIYPRKEWNLILKKLTEKTRKEEVYTAVWIPVIFSLVFWSVWYIGFVLGCLFALFYMWFRINYVKKNFAILPGKIDAEVIVTDSYLRVNQNFIHYADGRYFLKNLYRKMDDELGEHLHFVIGWYTSKGLPAEMDLYLPIPTGKVYEADTILKSYEAAKR